MMFRVHITPKLLNHAPKNPVYPCPEGNCHASKTIFGFDMFDSCLTPFGVCRIGYTWLGPSQMGNAHSEVKKLYELNNWEAGDTPISKLKKRMKIMGHDFAVAFYFDERSANGKLYKVVLAHFDSKKMDSAWLNSIKNILVEKYGNPAFFDVKDNMKISMWTKTAGLLKLTTLTGKTVMCAIEYMSVGTESKKL
jgi:hypothetical protein